MSVRDPGALRALLRQPYAARIVLSAAELDLFTPCHPGPASIEAVAGARGTDPRATGVMLEALASMGLLERREGGFACGPLAARHLATDSPEPLLGMVSHYLHQWRRWSQLSDVIRSGRPLPRHNQPARVHRDFVQAMDQGKVQYGLDALLPIPLEGVRRVIDLGGGPGTIALALARALPDAVVTLVDRPATIAIAAERVPPALWGTRVLPCEADLRSWSPEEGRYDLAISSAVIHAYDAATAAVMVGRAARCLVPGGRLVIRELLLDDPEPARALDAAVFAVGMLITTPRGGAFTGAQIEGWMLASGLEDLERIPVERGVALVGTRPG